MSLRVLAEIARIAAPTAVDLARGTLSREAVDARARACARRAVEALEVQLSVVRAGELDDARPRVYLFNHQSLLDVPILYAVLPDGPLRIVARPKLARAAVLGGVLRRAEFVELEEADALLADGICVGVSAEGTRARDGRVGPVEPGGFELARAAGVPLVPVAIRGTGDILPRGAHRMRAGVPVRVAIGVPIEAAERDVASMVEEVERFLRRHVENARVSAG